MAQPLPLGSSKDMWTDMGRLAGITKRANQYIEFFPKESYQINPYTRKSLSYVTGKVGEKPVYPCPQEIPGYWRIKCLYDKAYTVPMKKCNQSAPETEYQRYGWFSKPLDSEEYDERFVHKYKTAELIKTQILIKAYDRAINGIDSNKL